MIEPIVRWPRSAQEEVISNEWIRVLAAKERSNQRFMVFAIAIGILIYAVTFILAVSYKWI